MKLNHRYTITLNERLTEQGIATLRTLLATAEGEGLPVFLPTLPFNIEMVWKNDDGKLTTRIAHYYYKEHGIKLPKSLLTQIGNIARTHSLSGETFNFEFVNRINWDDGDFGDSGSCYWGSNAGAREMLQDNGAWAICFFDDDDDGIARAWLYNADKFWVLWNGYGFQHSPTLTIAQIFASFKGHTYKKISLYNNGSGDGTLYINNSAGYLIGTIEAIQKTDRYDLGFRDYYIDTCYDCDRTLYEDDVYWGPDDNTYCERCFHRFFDRCTMCGEVYEQDEITYIDGNYLCQDCLDNRTDICKKCGNRYVSYGYRSCLSCPFTTRVAKPIAKK